MTWTKNKVSLLTKMLADGHTAAQISKEVGKTRNAVIGKVRRLDLRLQRNKAGRKPDPNATKKRRVRLKLIGPSASRTKPKWNPLYTTHKTSFKKGNGRIIFPLGNDGCKFPIGDPQNHDFHYCDEKPRVLGKPYCVNHCMIAYRSPT